MLYILPKKFYNHTLMRFFRGWISRDLADNYSYSRRDQPNDQLTTSQIYEITKRDAGTMNRKMQNLPVLTHHKKDHLRVGQVTYTRCNGKDWEVEVGIDDTTPSGKFTCDLISNGMFCHFSLKHDRVSLTPEHVALCWRGAREGTVIASESVVSKNDEYKPFTVEASSSSSSNPLSLSLTEVFKSMSLSTPLPNVNVGGSDELQSLQNQLASQLQQRQQTTTTTSNDTGMMVENGGGGSDSAANENNNNNDDVLKSAFNKFFNKGSHILTNAEKAAVIEDKMASKKALEEKEKQIEELTRENKNLSTNQSQFTENAGTVIIEFLKDLLGSQRMDNDQLKKDVLSSTHSMRPSVAQAFVEASFAMKQLLKEKENTTKQPQVIMDPEQTARDEVINDLLYGGKPAPPAHYLAVEASRNARNQYKRSSQELNNNPKQSLNQLISSSAGWMDKLPPATRHLLTTTPDSTIDAIPSFTTNKKSHTAPNTTRSSSSSLDPVDDPSYLRSLKPF